LTWILGFILCEREWWWSFFWNFVIRIRACSGHVCCLWSWHDASRFILVLLRLVSKQCCCCSWLGHNQIVYLSLMCRLIIDNNIHFRIHLLCIMINNHDVAGDQLLILFLHFKQLLQLHLQLIILFFHFFKSLFHSFVHTLYLPRVLHFINFFF